MNRGGTNRGENRRYCKNGKNIEKYAGNNSIGYEIK